MLNKFRHEISEVTDIDKSKPCSYNFDVQWIPIQWNPGLTICQGSSKMISLHREYLIPGFCPIHFTVTFAEWAKDC